MVKKVINILLVIAVILAIWNLSGGDIGAFLLSTWNSVIFPVVSFISNIMITLWEAFVSLINSWF